MKQKQGTESMAEFPDESLWHKAFCTALKLELKENITDLEFIPGYNLNKEQVNINIFILKDQAGKSSNEIGQIMRTYNVIEYKTTKEETNIDDYAKTIGYALLYKGSGEMDDQIPISELTVSMFQSEHPKELFAELRREGHEIEEKYPGIYYLKNHLMFPVQFVVTSELSPETYRSLETFSDWCEKQECGAVSRTGELR
jgi:hypothetical protein